MFRVQGCREGMGLENPGSNLDFLSMHAATGIGVGEETSMCNHLRLKTISLRNLKAFIIRIGF